MISAAIYGHGGGSGYKGSASDRYVLVKDTERIEEIKNEMVKYNAAMLEQENCAEPITELHIIIKVPYKYKLVGGTLKVRELK